MIKKQIKKILEAHANILYDTVKDRYKDDLASTCSVIMAMQQTQEVFKKYKNINANKEVVIVATGPSLDDFVPIEGAVYIGMNRCALYNKVKFDYMFMQDYGAVHSYIEEMGKEQFADTRKFYGAMPQNYMNDIYNIQTSIPESIANRHGAERYYVPMQYGGAFQRLYPLDIGSQIMAIGGSVVSAAFQFALYTNPKTIYLVGCDVSSGHFGGDNDPSADNKDIIFWEDRKAFAETWYPETEIVSINPKGLRGIFKDVYQNANQK